MKQLKEQPLAEKLVEMTAKGFATVSNITMQTALLIGKTVLFPFQKIMDAASAPVDLRKRKKE